MLSRQTWLIFLLCAGVLVMIAAAGGSGQTRAPGSPGSTDDRPYAEPPVARRAESGSADSAAGNANGLRFSVTTTSIGNERAIVVVDSETQRLLIYSMDDSSRPPLLKLVAVRNLSYDVKLEHWNNAHPYPEEIRSSVTDEGRGE